MKDYRDEKLFSICKQLFKEHNKDKKFNCSACKAIIQLYGKEIYQKEK